MKKRILSLCLVLCLTLSLLPVLPVGAERSDTDIPYAVEGGNIYFNKATGTITDSDDSQIKPLQVEAASIEEQIPEAVQIYVQNRSVWEENFYSTKYYGLFDLEGDGIPELFCNYMFGSGLFSTNHYYKISKQKTVYELFNCCANDWDSDFDIGSGLRAFQDSKSGQIFYLVSDTIREGADYSGRTDAFIFISGDNVSYKNLWSVNYIQGNYTYTYYENGEKYEVTKDEWEAYQSAYLSNYTELDITIDDVADLEKLNEQDLTETLLKLYHTLYDSSPWKNEFSALIPNEAKEYGGHYYITYDGVANSWEDAEQYCESLGGHLATLTSQEESDAVYKIVRDAGYQSAYFGLTDRETEGTWEWVTGEPFVYQNWHVSEPNSENTNEDYGMFHYKYSDGTWNDGDFGGSDRAFICEWDGTEEQNEPLKVFSFNTYFVNHSYDNLNAMYQYDSVAKGVVENSSQFKINWNLSLQALTNKDFIDLSKLEVTPELYYELALLEAISGEKLKDEYLSSLAKDAESFAIDALDVFLNDKDYTMGTKVKEALADFDGSSDACRQIIDYFGKFSPQLENYKTVKAIYDLTAEAEGSVEDFFHNLSNYGALQQMSDEIVQALTYLRNQLNNSTKPDDIYMRKAIDNLLDSYNKNLNQALVDNCIQIAAEQAGNIILSSLSAIPYLSETLSRAEVIINGSLLLTDILFPTSSSSESYCKLYADYSIECVTREALKSAYNSGGSVSDDVIVGLYDLLGHVYQHEVQVASVLVDQLHKDGLLNLLRNLFCYKYSEQHQYDLACINAYNAYLNEILAGKAQAWVDYQLEVGELQPYTIVTLINGKVVDYNSGTVPTGSTFSPPTGTFALPGPFDFKYKISDYFTDEGMKHLYDKSLPVYVPITLYRTVHVYAPDGSDVLYDGATDVEVLCDSFSDQSRLVVVLEDSGAVYEQIAKESTGDFALFDLSLLQDGVVSQPDSVVTVKIPLQEKDRDSAGKVYRYEGESSYTNMNSWIEDGYYCFRTDRLGKFVVFFAPDVLPTLHYYEVFDTNMTWTEAKAYCESIGGHLVTITSEAEMKAVMDLVGSNALGCYWIGLSRDSVNSDWKWVTGEPVTYTNWAENEPNNDQTTNELYAHLFGTTYNGGWTVKNAGTWNDVANNGAPYVDSPFYRLSNFGFICEWDNGDDGKCHGDRDCPSRSLTDVPAPTNWAHEGIDYAIGNGLMQGTGNGKFEPDTVTTRAMIVTVLWRQAGEKKGDKNTFSDVPDGEWYTDAVAWAAANDIVKGTGNGKFEPAGDVTREQMVTILYRYCGDQGIDTSKTADLKSFPDAGQVNGYALDAMRWAVAEGIINGKVLDASGTTYLQPLGNASRAEIATILMRFIENILK